MEIALDPEAGAQAAWLESTVNAVVDDEERVGATMARDPLVVAPEDTLGEVAEHLVRRDATVAAVAEFGRLIGIVTSSDLLRASAARVHPSEARVRQWMTAEPVTVTAAMPLTAAAALMRAYDVGHLLVVEADRTVGMLSRDDVARNTPLAVGLGL